MAGEGNGSTHEMSLIVGELKGSLTALKESVIDLKGSVEHLNNNWKQKDAEATRGREDLRDRVEDLRIEMQTMKGAVDGVQQDVAEMKNDMAVQQATLDDYTQNKTIAVTAIGDVNKLKEFVQSFEKKEQRVLGWVDAGKKIGFVGWTIICGVGAGGVGLLFFWLQRFL